MNASKKGDHVCRFAGQRIQRMVERPWVLHPPIQDAGFHNRRARTLLNGQDRWNAVSTTLMDQVKQHGHNQSGELSVSADYLEALARLPIPNDIIMMSPQEGRSLGILDVLVTYGKGSKYGPGTPYLCQPTPLKLLEHGRAPPPYYRISTEESNERDDGQPPNLEFEMTRVSRRRLPPGLPTDEPAPALPDWPSKPRSVSHLSAYIEEAPSPMRHIARSVLQDRILDKYALPHGSVEGSLSLIKSNGQKATEPVRGTPVKPQPGLRPMDTSFDPSFICNLDGRLTKATTFAQPLLPRVQPSLELNTVSPTSQAAKTLMQLSRPDSAATHGMRGLHDDTSGTVNWHRGAASTSPEWSLPMATTPSTNEWTNPFTTQAPSLMSSPLSTPPSSPPSNPGTPSDTRWVTLKFQHPLVRPYAMHYGQKTFQSELEINKGASNQLIGQVATLVAPAFPSQQSQRPAKRMQNTAFPQTVGQPVGITLSASDERHKFSTSTQTAQNPSDRASDEKFIPETKLARSSNHKSHNDQAATSPTLGSARRPRAPRDAGAFVTPGGPASQRKTNDETMRREFVPGDLNEGCRIGYAEPGIVRQIPCKRGGWFKEKGVVMGTRYVIW